MQPFDADLPPTPAPAQPELASAPRRRPFGLYAILILLSLQALLGVVVVVALSLGFTVAAAETWAAIAPSGWGLFESVILMLVVAVVVVGLWRYRLWAWYGMMLLLAYWMATDAIGYFRGAPEYFSMLLNVVMVFYLNQREVRELFDPQSQQERAHL
jgi:hypothetical protein